MQSKNPVFGRAVGFNSRQAADVAAPSADELQNMYAAPSATPTQTGRMTYDDVVVKTGITFGVLLAGAVVGWLNPQFAMVGLIVGLVLGLVNAFKRNPTPALILAYAAFEGLFLGGISFMFENTEIGGAQLDGIVAQAVLGTLGVFAAALFAYRSGKVRVTPKFRRGAMIALGGYAVFVVVNLLAQMFGFADGTFGFRDGIFGILIGLFAVGLAAVMLVLDFDFIEKGVQAGLPAKYAWTAAFGLTVTLVWLYIEMLRLLAILQSGD
ncbi:putative YccA/Bax inhibitor family protein [Haloactinopolyspora alba]|uniref:Putative YccA/Bax inhibitor family protein n=1 Tax=Haloactinopolyspora alba TaxID=648780 RepID=A0A2P8DFY0_9ACTN|nr:Bax inhibitor-1/YccA family protein [Haloactinopolyspora alba]PSK96106.1 putative YccA/Bax inhibitor family protein [Haloactinopolyspora alba]